MGAKVTQDTKKTNFQSKIGSDRKIIHTQKMTEIPPKVK